MPIYGIGFLLAIALYFYFVVNMGRKIKSLDLIVGIVLGLFSWLGVIAMIIVFKAHED